MLEGEFYFETKEKKFALFKLFIFRLICLAVTTSIGIAGIMTLFNFYAELHVTCMWIIACFSLFSDAFFTKIIKKELLSSQYSGSGIFVINKIWFYLDFIIGIPLLLVIIIRLIQDGIGIRL